MRSFGKLSFQEHNQESSHSSIFKQIKHQKKRVRARRDDVPISLPKVKESRYRPKVKIHYKSPLKFKETKMPSVEASPVVSSFLEPIEYVKMTKDKTPVLSVSTPVELEIKTWMYPQKVTLFLKEEKLYARVYSSSGAEACLIPATDINIPCEVVQNPLYLLLFTDDSYIRLVNRSDDSMGLYVYSRLKGGDFWGFLMGASAVVGGALLMATTGPVGGIIASGLINVGLEGAIHGLQHEKNLGLEECVAGFAAGAVTGCAATFASGISVGQKLFGVLPKLPNSTAVLAAKAGIHAVAGGLAQAINSYPHGLSTEKIIGGALMGGCVGGMAGNIMKGSYFSESKVATIGQIAVQKGVDTAHSWYEEKRQGQTDKHLAQQEAQKARQDLQAAVALNEGLRQQATALREQSDAAVRVSGELDQRYKRVVAERDAALQQIASLTTSTRQRQRLQPPPAERVSLPPMMRRGI